MLTEAAAPARAAHAPVRIYDLQLADKHPFHLPGSVYHADGFTPSLTMPRLVPVSWAQTVVDKPALMSHTARDYCQHIGNIVVDVARSF